MSKPICWRRASRVQLFKWCWNLSAWTVLQRCSCLSGVETYLAALCCRVGRLKRFRNLSAGTVLQRCSCWNSVATCLPGTVLQGCSCLSGVTTYLPALFCRDAAVKVVSKPTCWHCAAGVQLFKWCLNLFARTVLQRCRLFKWCWNLSAGTVLQRCSCLSGIETYLPELCWRGAAVEMVSKPFCWHCIAGVQLFKWCRNLSAGTVLQRCSCLSGVETYLPKLCCRGAAV